MSVVGYLRYWLSGTGTPLQVIDFVPESDSIRQWADTFPWEALVDAIEVSFAERFPKKSNRGRRPVPIRVLLALELLKPELGASDDDICRRLRTDFAIMYACGLRDYQINPDQSHFVLPETLCEFRRRFDEPLMDELIAIQAAAAMDAGLVSPAHLVVDTFPCEQGSQRVTDATTLYNAQKKTLELIARLTQQCSGRQTQLQCQVQTLGHDLRKVMRSFGRSCRGQGRVFVKLVRQTEEQLLERGETIEAFGLQALKRLQVTPKLSESQRERLTSELTTALSHHEQIRKQSKRLTQGKKLSHFKVVNAYDPTIAPIVKGKSNCPTQFGRKPGIISEPATGFIFANLTPEGNPYDANYVLPLVDKVEAAAKRLQRCPKSPIHSVAGDMGINDPVLRQALHERQILTVGIPKTVVPIEPNPSPEEVLNILDEANLNRQRTPHQVHLACMSGYSRPVVESHIASLLSRGAGQVRYKGLEGAIIQQGMTVMAHNGAVLVRIDQRKLSKRAQKFRRLMRLKTSKANKINHSKN